MAARRLCRPPKAPPVRRTALCLTLALSLAACSPYDPPAAAEPSAAATCDRACWEAVIAHQHAERAWWAEVVAQQRRQRDWNRLLAYLAAHRRTGHCYIDGVRVCDGPGLLPYHIVWRESRMNPRARNPRSSAGGYAQMLIGTMRSVCPAEAARYGNAANAPVAVQVECVRRLIARHGLAPWRL